MHTGAYTYAVVGKNNPERIGKLEAFNRELCTSRLMLRCDEISGRWHVKDFSFTTSLFDGGCVFIVNDTKIHSLCLVRGFCYLSRLVKTGGAHGKVRKKRKCKRAREGKASHVALSHVSSLNQQRETFWCLLTRFSRHVFFFLRTLKQYNWRKFYFSFEGRSDDQKF